MYYTTWQYQRMHLYIVCIWATFSKILIYVNLFCLNFSTETNSINIIGISFMVCCVIMWIFTMVQSTLLVCQCQLPFFMQSKIDVCMSRCLATSYFFFNLKKLVQLVHLIQRYKIQKKIAILRSQVALLVFTKIKAFSICFELNWILALFFSV